MQILASAAYIALLDTRCDWLLGPGFQNIRYIYVYVYVCEHI